MQDAIASRGEPVARWQIFRVNQSRVTLSVDPSTTSKRINPRSTKGLSGLHMPTVCEREVVLEAELSR
jgi:hypothetical protein